MKLNFPARINLMMRILFLLFPFVLFSAPIEEKVLICGVCKNIEKAIPNTIGSIEDLGSRFEDYRVVIYENNSKDMTKKLLKRWATHNPRVIFLSETLKKKKLKSQLAMKVRTEKIARARNKVLDEIMKKKYDDYKYVIWADLDFLKPWDVKNIIDTIQNPQVEWDAVFANGAYDLFAFRDAEFPCGPELIGKAYWDKLEENKLFLDPSGKWKKVYSAFGGLGIYKREAIKGCRYSGVITKALKGRMNIWAGDQERKRDSFSEWTCEHVNFHAEMANKGHDRLFINPKLISEHP